MGIADALKSKQELKLQMELIINRRLYSSNKIMQDTYSRVEQDILREIENEKVKINKKDIGTTAI